MKKLSMLLVLCAAILPLGAIQTYSANQVQNVSAPHGFSIAQGETLTVDSIKEKSGASGDVTVSQTALNAINGTGSAGIIYTLPILVNGGTYNIVVAKAGSNVATNGTIAIYAANIVANTDFDINNVITLASVKAYDLVNGYTITDQVSVVDNGNAITFSVNGLSKQITVSNRGGSKEMPAGEAKDQTDPNQPGQDTPQDKPQQPEGVTLDANDTKITPEVAQKIKDVSELVNMMAAKGTDVGGAPLDVTAITADFAAIQAGTEGDYTINFTAETAKGETVSTTATLTIKAFKLEEQQGQVAFINANNKLLTTTGTTDKVKSLDDLKTVMGVKATVSDKDALAQVTVTATNDAELLKGTPGTYEVTFKIEGKDQYTSAKTTVILTVVSDDTPITPDGKGYLSATNFLVTTDEAKQITSNKDYNKIHSATGNYDGRYALITATVADNAKIVNGYQGIFDVKFTLDGDGDTTTTDDQVSVTKKLTVVFDTKGRDVDAPVAMFPELNTDGHNTGKINTIFDYTNYTKEQRIEGKFAIVMRPQFYSDTKYYFTVQEFLDLTYEQVLSLMSHLVIGQNGEYINNYNVISKDNPILSIPDQQIEEIKTNMITSTSNVSLFGLSEPVLKQLQTAVKEASTKATGTPHSYLEYSPYFEPVVTVLIDGRDFFEGDDITYLMKGRTSIFVAEPGSPELANAPLNKYNPPAQDMMNGMVAPQDVVKFSGQAETVVLRNQLNDTSVANVSALTNTQVLDKGQVVAPEGVTLNPATVPAYGSVQANYTYKDITYNNTLYVYPTNAILNPTQDGYVAGSDNMVTQAELNNVKTADQFFALIQASSATATKQFANPTVTCDNIDDLKAGKVGVYRLTLENADKSAKTEVVFTVRPNKSNPTEDNKGYVDAVGSFVTEKQAKQITKQDFLAAINNATAVYNGATIAPTVEIAPESFAKIQAGTKGVYQVTYKIDMNGQTATKTVNLAVAPEGSKFTGDGLGFIYAQDATINSSQAQALTDPSELIAIHEAFAFYGENEEAPIVVKTDFAAIQASRGGEYQVTFLLDGGNNPMTREGGLQPNQAEISVVLTVIDDITDPKPAEPTPVVAQPAPQIPTGVKNAAIGLGLVVAIAAAGLVLIKRNRK